jgi:hypothetical protein
MDIPKYFNNVVLAQYVVTGIPLKVYVNGQYLIIPDVYEISDSIIGSGMDPDGNMQQFDYREIDHLLVGGNIVDLETYGKALAGDTPAGKKEKEEEEEEETKEESYNMAEITKDVLKAREKALDAEEDALKDKRKALKDEPITEALDGSFANAQKLLRNSTVVAYEFDRNSNGDWFVLIKYVPMNKQKVEMTVVNMGQDYSPTDLSKIKREFGLDKPVRKKYKLSNPMSGGQGYGEIFENVNRPEEKKTAILNAIAKEEKRSEFQNRVLRQIKRAIVDGEPLFKLPFKTQADYRRLMKMYKIPFSSKRAEKGNLRAESIIKKGSYVTNMDGLVGRVDNISGDKEIADIRYNDGKEESLPIKKLKIFEDHHYTFGIGDIVKNKNTSCPHQGSMGIVQKIMKLANDMGKVVRYRVVNSGPTYNPGDVLTKTIDQLEPVRDN